jgi:raffinose/stachyose/melibiose transport system permease protein
MFLQKIFKHRYEIIQYTICIFFVFVVIIPIGVTILGGLKTTGELRVNPFGLPNPPQWQNHIDILTHTLGAQYWTNLFNSTVIMVLTVVTGLTLCTMAGFVLARIKFLGRTLIFNFFLLGLLFPIAVAILPLYIQLRNLDLLNNYLGVVLPQVAFGMPWNIMLLRGYFSSIPKEIEDSTAIDGGGPIRFLIWIVIPLSKPAIATVGVLQMVASWNNFFLPLLVLDNSKLFTLPMGIMDYQGQYQVNWALVMAFITLSIIPAVVFYIFAQKQIVAGLTGGAIKG